MPENNVKQDLVRDINPTRLTALEKVAMPQDPEAEMSVLSAMMYDEDAPSLNATVPLTPFRFPIRLRATESLKKQAVPIALQSLAAILLREWAGNITRICSTATKRFAR